MRDLAILFLHLIATVTTITGGASATTAMVMLASDELPDLSRASTLTG